MVRTDGAFEIVPRPGAVLISTTGILGPCSVQGQSIYPTIVGLPQDNLGDLEDSVVRYSGCFYLKDMLLGCSRAALCYWTQDTQYRVAIGVSPCAA
jgi:hypothetical protein